MIGKTTEQQVRMECLKVAMPLHTVGGAQRGYDAVLRTAQAFYEWVNGDGDHILTEKAQPADVKRLADKWAR